MLSCTVFNFGVLLQINKRLQQVEMHEGYSLQSFIALFATGYKRL